MAPARPIPIALSIAGSDPSGGAGIQADLKTFSALGAYGMSVLTALTVQNTHGVRGVHAVPPEFIGEQIDALFEDTAIDAVKLGMLGAAPSVAAVAERLAVHRPATVVVDPVMVAKSGHRLLDDDAVATVRERLLPLASLITPNLPEAAVLLDDAPAHDVEAMRATAERLHALGPAAVLVKGGHLADGDAVDVFYDGAAFTELRAPRVATRNTHGTGCTLSSAIAALAPRASNLQTAVAGAKRYLTGALQAADSLPLAHTTDAGHGPVHHFHALWNEDPAGSLLEHV
ncbi:MAG: bifunctional hydroxymethylpyrimidine kinase/phosphomethylpyrimidine kinase [Halofilum sp. (in: g-proteobacteria)]